MKHILILTIIFFCFTGVSVAESGEISADEAEKLINEHIGTWYADIPYQKSFPKFNKDHYEKYLAFLSGLQNLKLITFTLNEDGMNYNFVIQPTKESSFINNEYKGDEFGIVGGSRKVDQITKIEGDNVFFTYTFTPNNVGKTAGYTTSQFQGKAKLAYHKGLGKLIFRGFHFCPFGKSGWHESSWTYTKDGKVFYRTGIAE